MSIVTVGSPPYAAFYQISVQKYHRMIEAGILDEDDRVELVEGYLVPRMAQKPAHAGALNRTRARIEALLPSAWRTRIQLPITLSDSEPEPDVAIVRGDDRAFDLRHPGPGDVRLVVEVADSSLTVDRDMKARIYARAGIPVYWIVNLVDRQVEVCSDPGGQTAPAYASRRDYPAGTDVPLVVDQTVLGSIPVSELLP